MSDDQKTPSPGPAPAQPQPFERKPAQWGRMPATTFHVGPVPVAPNPLDRLPNPPPRKPPVQGQSAGQGLNFSPAEGRAPARPPAPAPAQRSGGIMSGSLIPQTRPASAKAATSKSEPSPAGPDLTVRPLPVAKTAPVSPPHPEPTPTATIEQDLAPVTVAETPKVIEVAPATPQAASPRRAASRQSASRLPLLIGAGAAAALVIGGGLWFALRSQPAQEAPPVSPPEAVAPVSPPPAEQPQDVQQPLPTAPTPPATAPAAAPAAPNAARTTTSPARAATPQTVTSTVQQQHQSPRAASPSAPTTQAPASGAAAAVEPPVVVVVPQASAPTPARAPQTDPNAPVVTRPQPLD